jgi:hypothetical protein
MTKLLLPVLFLTAAAAHGQLKPQTLEQTAARRWTEMNTDRIAGTADGQGITMSDVRRQIEPVLGQIQASVRTDAEFEKAVKQAAEEILRNMADRQVVLAEFRATSGQIPSSFVDADIEDTVRRDFGGDRSRYVSSLRAAGMTPLSHRKLIEDRIIFDYMLGRARRSAMTVSPGKLAAYYESHRAEFERKEQVKLGQITVAQGAAETLAEAKARAETWAQALRTSGPSLKEAFTKAGLRLPPSEPGFEDVAKAVSTDDYSSKGGDAGWRNLADLNERVAGVLRGLKDGEISEPLQFDLPGGRAVWFIVRRGGYRPQGFATLKDQEVLTQIEDKVRAAAVQQTVREWLEDLRTKHHVEFR